jgi:hypothetical protein
MASAISKNRSPRTCSRTYRLPLPLFRANIRRQPIWVCRTGTFNGDEFTDGGIVVSGAVIRRTVVVVLGPNHT